MGGWGAEVFGEEEGVWDFVAVGREGWMGVWVYLWDGRRWKMA